MLQNMRDHAQGWIAWVIAGILCVAFALWGVEYYVSDGEQAAPLATVNGQEISATQFEGAYKRLQQSYNIPLDSDDTVFKKVKDQALQDLVRQTVLTQAATETGYIINNDQISAWLINLPDFQENGKFSPTLFQQIIRQYFPTEQAFLSDLHDKAMILQAKTAVVLSAFALPYEIDHLFKLTHQKRDVSLVTVPATRFLSTTDITDQQIADYYKANSAAFMTQPQVSLQYIVLSADKAASQMSVDEATLKQYYEENKAVFSSPAEWKIARIFVNLPENSNPQAALDAEKKINTLYQKINAGQDFSALALSTSDDKVTAIKGGLVGWVKQTEQPAQLAQTINLLKSGQTSAPLRTADGWVLIKLLEIKEPEVQSYLMVHDRIAKDLTQQKLSQVLAEQADQLANLVYTNADTLQPAADALHLNIQTTPLFSRESFQDVPLLVEHPKLLTLAFSDNLIKQRNNSDVISLNDQEVAVFRINQFKPVMQRPLAEVRQEIENRLKQKSAGEQALAKAMKILDMLKQGTPLDKITNENKLTVNKIQDFTRQTTGQPTSVTQLIFSLPSAQKDKISADVATVENGDAVIVVLNKINLPNIQSDDEKDKAGLKDSLAAQQGALEYELYVEYYVKQAKIK